MSDTMKKAFAVEIAVLVLSLLPLLLSALLPTILGGEMDDDMMAILYVCVYCTYAGVSLVAGFFGAFWGMSWQVASLIGPLSYLLGAFMFLGVTLLEMGICAIVYYGLGILPGMLAIKYKKDKLERDKRLGRL